MGWPIYVKYLNGRQYEEAYGGRSFMKALAVMWKLKRQGKYVITLEWRPC